jgi:(p)ppGpp synthase/HD superfamily hydrolase
MLTQIERPRWISGSEVLGRAYELAFEAHRDQLRATDATPFLDHVVEVGRLLLELGYTDDVVAAGLLHDSVERGTLTEGELQAAMGDAISALVLALTEDAGIESFGDRKLALRRQVEAAGEPAMTIFAADKLSDIRGLRRGLRESPETIAERIGASVGGMAGHYQHSVEMIERNSIDPEFVELLRGELGQLSHAA